MVDDGPDKWGPPSTWFADWWQPNALADSVRAERASLQEKTAVDSATLRFLHDAAVAARFAAARREERLLVRLVDGAFPDFKLKHESRIEDFELVEADEPGRRLDQERQGHMERRTRGEFVEAKPYDPWTAKRLAPKAIRRAIQKKAVRRYAVPPHLLVHIDVGAGVGPVVTPDQAQYIARDFEAVFRSIWLLCGSEAVRCSRV